MSFAAIATQWAMLDQRARMVILTEPERMPLAQQIREDNLRHAGDILIVDLSCRPDWQDRVRDLTGDDLLLVLLTIKGYMNRGYRDHFSPFAKPLGLKSKYAFVRLDIPEESLLSGLRTDPARVESILSRCRSYQPGKWVRVTTGKGTDLTARIASQEEIPHCISSPGGIAFLPPAEISEELVPGSAAGVIVVDTTVGDLRFGPELVDPLGLVDQEVRITVQDGLVAGIEGGDTAHRLKSGLNRLDRGLQTLVELGHGLSDLSPTGIIGVDESMNDTCHFGIGNRNPYHVDVVVSNPTITLLAD